MSARAPHLALSAPPVILKFGGAALATPGRVRRAVARIRHHREGGALPVVVASAAGRTTDRILARLEAVGAGEGGLAPGRDREREAHRALLSGEDRSAALLAAAFLAAGIRARSLDASEAGLRARKGRLPTLDPGPLLRLLSQGVVPVVGGFQAEGPGGERVTLERGGSDLTAVLLAAHLRATACILVKDVAGVHAADPARDPAAPLHSRLDWEALEELSILGARVLQPEAARQARRHHVPLHFVHFRSPPGRPGGTEVGGPGPQASRASRASQASRASRASEASQGSPAPPDLQAEALP